MAFKSINFKKWIDEHKSLWKPPVCNDIVWKDREFMIMVVGGPNIRKDFHVNQGEEFFYQLEGDMVLRVVEDGVQKDVPICEGEIFLLPPRVPHSPQRQANTVGLVVERRRREGELDGFVWYCDGCQKLLHRAELVLTDITTQLKPIFDGFWADEAKRTCEACGHVLQPPEAPVAA
jgi:3-hydroxyanthranilate 3,4-dioxygenase